MRSLLAEVQAQVDALLAHWRGLLRQDLELAPAWARVLDDPFLGALALRFLFARAVLANFRPPPSPSPPSSSASPTPGGASASSAPPLQVSAPLIFSPSRRRKAEPVPGLTRTPPRLVDAAGRSGPQLPRPVCFPAFPKKLDPAQGQIKVSIRHIARSLAREGSFEGASAAD